MCSAHNKSHKKKSLTAGTAFEVPGLAIMVKRSTAAACFCSHHWSQLIEISSHWISCSYNKHSRDKNQRNLDIRHYQRVSSLEVVLGSGRIEVKKQTEAVKWLLCSFLYSHHKHYKWWTGFLQVNEHFLWGGITTLDIIKSCSESQTMVLRKLNRIWDPGMMVHSRGLTGDIMGV